MIILDFVLLILAVTIFTLGCFVYFKNTASSLNKYFFIYCLSGSYTAFIQFMCFSANDYNAAYRWLKFGSLWPFMFVFLFHLLLIFVKEERKTNKIFLYLLIYLPAGCFSALNYFTTVPVKTNFGNYEMNTNSEVGILLGVWISIVSLIMLFYCIRFHFQTADRLKRKQAKYIFISLIIPIIASIIDRLAFGCYGFKIPLLTTVSSFSIPVFIGYAIWKYELFKINPANVAENIILTMDDGLILIDNNLIIITINKSLLYLLGYREDELIDKLVTVIFVQKESVLLEPYKKLLLAKKVNNLETTFIKKDGSLVLVSLSISPELNKNGEVIGSVIIARDISELKKYQDQLFQSEKLVAIGQLAGGVAHEINNPLTAILGFTQLMIKDSTADNPDLPALKTIEKESRRCKLLVERLLIFSRKEKLELKLVNINELIENLTVLIEIKAKPSNIEITRKFEPDIDSVLVNNNQIEEVIINLCNNAIDAMNNGGKLILGTKQINKDYIEILVEDTGKGMTHEEQKHLFEPFFTTKEVGKGTGLGLAIVYKIIQEHNGKIKINSVTGGGTQVTITLPIN